MSRAMKTVDGYVCDGCQREVMHVSLGDRNEDLCDDCYDAWRESRAEGTSPPPDKKKGEV